VLCQNAVQKIESGDPAKKGEYLKEYEDALADLEEELLAELKKSRTSDNML